MVKNWSTYLRPQAKRAATAMAAKTPAQLKKETKDALIGNVPEVSNWINTFLLESSSNISRHRI